MPLAPAETEAPVKKKVATTAVCVPTGLLGNTAKWVSVGVLLIHKTFIASFKEAS